MNTLRSEKEYFNTKMKNKKKSDLDLLEEFSQFVKATEKGKRTKKNGTRILKCSIAKLVATYKILKNFSVLKDCPLKIKVFYKDLDCYDNYAGSVMKDLKAFFNYLIIEKNMMVGNYHKKFYAYKEDIEIVTLQPEQLNFLIYDKNFEELLSPTLLKVKDIFVVGCTVSLRYSDLINLKPFNLEKENNQWYLKVQSKKTQTYTRIKLPQYVIQIFLKYKNKKRLLPFFNPVGLNLHLKRLTEKAGWIEEKIKTRQKKGIAMIVYKDKIKKIHYRFCDHITTHTMRRTAITTMLRLQMPEHLVRKISGHAPGSKEFHKYVAISQNYLDAETDKVFEKLNEMQTKNDSKSV